MNILEVRDLCKSFGGLQAVDNVSFSVKQNHIKAIIGPNGAGKTTLFNLISGSLKTDSGSILYKKEIIQNNPPYKIARKGLSRTFQNIKLFGNMTVLENVMVGRHIRSRAGFLNAIMPLPRARHEEKVTKEKAEAIISMLGIGNLSHLEASGLPFGKQRIVEFARSLAMEPEILLLDEPAAGLNIQETEDIAKTISKIRDQGITILIIEHDMSLIMDISDTVMVLSSGVKIAEGDPKTIQRDKEVIKVYLGDDDA